MGVQLHSPGDPEGALLGTQREGHAHSRGVPAVDGQAEN